MASSTFSLLEAATNAFTLLESLKELVISPNIMYVTSMSKLKLNC